MMPLVYGVHKDFIIFVDVVNSLDYLKIVIYELLLLQCSELKIYIYIRFFIIINFK